MKYTNIREEELKNKIATDFFDKFDCTEIIKNIDFAVKIKDGFRKEYLLWAEAKASPTDIAVMLAQLILTIGKARIHHEILPPPFLGCFDRTKIALIPFSEIQEIFYKNDFNWNVAPSNRETQEFKYINKQINKIIDNNKKYVFDFEKDEKELRQFIRENFVAGKNETSKIQIDRNNFISVYNKWLEKVKPTILVNNWEKMKQAGIIDGDFYLADLLSSENQTLKEKLSVVLRKTVYIMGRHKNDMGFLTSSQVDFSDKQRAHTQFWAKYERPPKEEFWDYITDRHDLLVPRDIRERKGSYYTPKIWMELSQKYITDVLGEDWQDNYYVWDCAAGTGNLLTGLTNKYRIWASTLDKTDVDIMHDKIENGANLLDEHVFQFDFLNDDFEKLPQGLRNIINDEDKRKKLIIYINPPYAEDTTKTTISKTGKNKGNVAKNKIHDKYANLLKKANHELFAQFLIRIYKEIQSCKIANFAKLKVLCASNFADFRKNFQAKLESLFIVPADTFYNVKGQFPIGFHIWDTSQNEMFEEIVADVFDKNGILIGTKTFSIDDNIKSINKWIKIYEYKNEKIIGHMPNPSPDVQHNDQIFIQSKEGSVHVNYTPISKSNLIHSCVYFAVRHCIETTWLNDRDQFLYPNDGWKKDTVFQNDCLAYTLFHGQNNISSKHGVNHWIPFIEYDVGAKNNFDSSFMTDFIAGNVETSGILAEPITLFYDNFLDMGGGGGGGNKPKPRKFSKTAQDVFKAGKELWRYYHAQSNIDVNASYYDIRERFQGRNARGTMNPNSGDEQYMELISKLRAASDILAKKIEPKVYEYGFLKE